jgi:hypothetical protein
VFFLHRIIFLMFLFLLLFLLRGNLNFGGIVLRDNDFRRYLRLNLLFIRVIVLRLHIIIIVIDLLNLCTFPLRLRFGCDQRRVYCLQIGGVIDRRRLPSNHLLADSL